MADDNSGQPAIADTQTPPNETDAEAEVLNEGAEAAPAVNDADETSTPKPKGKGSQDRINELTWKQREAERERDYWRNEALKPTPKEKVIEDTPKAEPKLEDFNYDETLWKAALIKHASTEAARQVRAELQQEQAQAKIRTRDESFVKRQMEFAKDKPDYQEKAFYAPMSDAMVEIIKESDVGPAVAYFLGNNRDIAQRIATMSERDAAREIGKIEARLEVPKPAAVIPPKTKVSEAPPPVPKIEASGDPVIKRELSDATLSDAEFAKIRKRQIAQRR